MQASSPRAAAVTVGSGLGAVRARAVADVSVREPAADHPPERRGEPHPTSADAWGRGQLAERDWRRPHVLRHLVGWQPRWIEIAEAALARPAVTCAPLAREERVIRRSLKAVVPVATQDDRVRRATRDSRDGAPAPEVREHHRADRHLFDRHEAAIGEDESPGWKARWRRHEQVEETARDRLARARLVHVHAEVARARVVLRVRLDGDVPVVHGDEVHAEAERGERALRAGRGAAGAAEEVGDLQGGDHAPPPAGRSAASSRSARARSPASRSRHLASCASESSRSATMRRNSARARVIW